MSSWSSSLAPSGALQSSRRILGRYRRRAALAFPALVIGGAVALGVAGPADPVHATSAASIGSTKDSRLAPDQTADAAKSARAGSVTASAHPIPDRAGASLPLAKPVRPRAEARKVPKAVDPFDRLASKADLSSRKLALLLEAAKDKSATRTAAANAPAPERFAAATDFAGATAPVLLAYADPSPTVGNESVAAVAAMASAGLAEVAGEEQAGEPVDPAAAPGLLPETVPLPGSRPEIDAKTRKLLRAEESPKPAKPQTRLAYARPDNPVEEKPGSGFGRFKNLFGARPKAGKGVAVYDISAKKVYMPDGSVLEAHSGIGKMADDPRYVNVKMNGPTPPHTYNLRMRETRFHGVEAIRMIPVDGKNKYGRDGFLTHSYLLRSRRPESHGCVAFKDYPKFLAAFKKGQVKQLVVVPGSGKGAVRVAKNGRDA